MTNKEKILDIEKLLLPLPKIRKGTKAKPSVPHKDKRKKEKKHKGKYD